MSVGAYVTSFFHDTLEIHLTPTALRSLVETTAQEAYDENRISRKQREAIMDMNGHSSQTTKDFYVRRNKRKDLTNGAYPAISYVRYVPLVV